MKQLIKYIVLSFVLLSSFFVSNKVNALVKVETGPIINSFTFDQVVQCNLIRRYYYVDENDNRQVAKSSDTQTYYCGSVITLNQGLMNLDYNSVSYYIGTDVLNQNTYVLNSDTTIDEVYYLNRYNITYNLDGGNLNNGVSTYTSMTPTFTLATPTKTNNTFGGWCVDNNCSTTYTVNQGSTGDISVSALWHQNYTVSYTGDTNSYSHTPTGNNVTTYATAEFETTITLNNNYTLESASISMGGRVLTENTEYSLSGDNRTYTLTIFSVSGNISIDIQTTNSSGGTNPCLAEGTLVTLWDGSTKKIEDIKYNDLLKVWNHDLGAYGYEYAGWIEKAGNTNQYTKITFSDGNELKIIGNHSLFSKTKNKYVNVNSSDLNIGDEVVNISDGINYVYITNIEHIEENINYYHVISTRYFNLITNNILSTYEIYNNVSNFMDFDNNLKWQNTDIVRSDMYTYDDFLYLDKYIYKVFRLEETKYLVNSGLVSLDQFGDLFDNYLMNNDKKVNPPTNENGERLWMVTTSDDYDPSDIIHHYVEGSEYIVPMPKESDNFLYWYNHSDNKIYNPSEIIEVDSGIYLEAIYE